MAEQNKPLPLYKRKVLIVKINAIGDVVMALPMATYLRALDPNVHITWICGKTPAPLLEAVGIVDEIIKTDEKQLLTGSFLKKLWALAKIWKKLAFASFDQIFIAHLDSRYRLLTLFTRAKEQKNLSFVPGRYHSDEYVRLVSGKEAFNQCKAILPKWTYPLDRNLKEIIDQEKKPIVALAPGGAKNALADNPLRRWPIQHYVALAKELSSKNYTIALTGAASDAWILHYFAELDFLNLVGKADLPNLVSFYKYCALLITHDSGPLHLAKLANIPTIALFGPTLPSHFVPSNTPKIKLFWGGKDLPCRPCHDGKKFANCGNNLCMNSISPKDVEISALEILKFFS